MIKAIKDERVLCLFACEVAERMLHREAVRSGETRAFCSNVIVLAKRNAYSIGSDDEDARINELMPSEINLLSDYESFVLFLIQDSSSLESATAIAKAARDCKDTEADEEERWQIRRLSELSM